MSGVTRSVAIMTSYGRDFDLLHKEMAKQTALLAQILATLQQIRADSARR